MFLCLTLVFTIYKSPDIVKLYANLKFCLTEGEKKQIMVLLLCGTVTSFAFGLAIFLNTFFSLAILFNPSL